jgi:hypothetical protein
VPILRSIQDHPPELLTVLVPSLVRVMLAAAVEVMVAQEGKVAHPDTLEV